MTFDDISPEEGRTATRLTLRTLFATAEERNFKVEKYGAIEGGQQTLSRLAEHIVKRSDASDPGAPVLRCLLG